jgi:uncharacterized protein YfaQ (DUF2300 family)
MKLSTVLLLAFAVLSVPDLLTGMVSAPSQRAPLEEAVQVLRMKQWEQSVAILTGSYGDRKDAITAYLLAYAYAQLHEPSKVLTYCTDARSLKPGLESPYKDGLDALQNWASQAQHAAELTLKLIMGDDDDGSKRRDSVGQLGVPDTRTATEIDLEVRRRAEETWMDSPEKLRQTLKTIQDGVPEVPEVLLPEPRPLGGKTK